MSALPLLVLQLPLSLEVEKEGWRRERRGQHQSVIAPKDKKTAVQLLRVHVYKLYTLSP